MEVRGWLSPTLLEAVLKSSCARQGCNWLGLPATINGLSLITHVPWIRAQEATPLSIICKIRRGRGSKGGPFWRVSLLWMIAGRGPHGFQCLCLTFRDAEYRAFQTRIPKKHAV